MKIKGHELEVKSQECEQLEKVVLESQSMLQIGTSRIHELEELQAQLQEQVSWFMSVYFILSRIFVKSAGFELNTAPRCLSVRVMLVSTINQ